MGDWQEIVALGIVAVATLVLGFRAIRQWMGTIQKAGGCGGCSDCGSQSGVPKAVPSTTRNPSITYQLLELEVKPSCKDRSVR